MQHAFAHIAAFYWQRYLESVEFTVQGSNAFARHCLYANMTED